MLYFLLAIFIAAIVIAVVNGVKRKKNLTLIHESFTGAGYKLDNIIELQNDVIGINTDTGKLSTAKFKTQKITHFPLSGIRDYEIQKDGVTVYKKTGSVGRAVVGGLLFGGVGAIVGAAGSKSSGKEKVKSANIKIFTNDVDAPSFIITIFEKDQPSALKKKYLDNAQVLADKLAIIIDQRNVAAAI